MYEYTLTNFNGKVYLTFYDKESSLSTLGTNPGSDNLPFKMWKNVIYKGKSSAVNGKFSFTFKIPKDIGYDYGFSRISLYAEDGELDASGYNDSLIIGGIDTTASSNGPFTFTIDASGVLSLDLANLPTVFNLYQNYPNPFNPITTIQYDIPENSYVSLEIYDVLGKKVKTLVSKSLNPGRYKIMWDATNDYGQPVSADQIIETAQT